MFYVVILFATLFFPLSVFADNKPELTVYTYSSFVSEWGPGREIKLLFEAQCNCHVNYSVFGDGVTILNRLKLERENSRADVIVGLDNNLILAAKQADLVQPHRLNAFKNMQLHWWHDMFIPYDYGYFAFVYNKNKVTHPPQSMHDLLSRNNNWKIVYQDPRTSTPGLGLVLWIQSIYGDKSAKIWSQLAKKTLTVTHDWSAAYNLMLNNEADFVLSYDTSPVAHRMNQDKVNYAAAAFKEGHTVQIEVAAIAKTSRQFNLAQQFLLFLGTPNIQYLIATHNIMHPVVNVPLPAEFDDLITINKRLQLPNTVIESNRKRWITLWQRAVSQ